MKKITIILVIFFFDRITKMYFINLQEAGSDLPITIFSFLDFILIYNFGNAFGIFQLEPNSTAYHSVTIFIGFINFVIFLLIFERINNLYLIKKFLNFLSIPSSWRKNIYTYMFALILGGSLGNLYDRVVYYGVVDFIDLHIGSVHWPAFNIADTFITIGLIGLILLVLFKKEEAF